MADEKFRTHVIARYSRVKVGAILSVCWFGYLLIALYFMRVAREQPQSLVYRIGAWEYYALFGFAALVLFTIFLAIILIMGGRAIYVRKGLLVVCYLPWRTERVEALVGLSRDPSPIFENRGGAIRVHVSGGRSWLIHPALFIEDADVISQELSLIIEKIRLSH